jgi:hypothetical protein
MRKIALLLATVASAATLAFAAAGTAAAGTGPGATTAVTHTMNHPDTTSASGPGCGTSANGPVWAYDNLSLRYVATPNGTNMYSVTIYAHGSFKAIADPNTCIAASFNGSVDGSITYQVTSTTTPDPGNVPAQQPSGDTGQGDILVNQLFDGNGAITGGGSYSYTYNPVDGGKYTQSG